MRHGIKHMRKVVEQDPDAAKPLFPLTPAEMVLPEPQDSVKTKEDEKIDAFQECDEEQNLTFEEARERAELILKQTQELGENWLNSKF